MWAVLSGVLGTNDCLMENHVIKGKHHTMIRQVVSDMSDIEEAGDGLGVWSYMLLILDC